MTNNVLYRFFDAGKALLYVGITSRPPQRFKDHGREKEWWREVATIEMQHFDDRASLEQAERKAIKRENPRYNVIYKELPPFRCEVCSKILGRQTVHLVIEAGAIACLDCAGGLGGVEAHARFYPQCGNPWHDLHDHTTVFARRCSANSALRKLEESIADECGSPWHEPKYGVLYDGDLDG